MPTEIKECPKHGQTEFVLEGRGYYRCKKCRVANVTEQRRRNKRKLVEACGSECKLCGYNRCIDALHFHHLDPSRKSFGIAEGTTTRRYKVLLEEAAKCILVCSNCHAEIEAGIVQL